MTTRVRIKTKSGEVLAEGIRHPELADDFLVNDRALFRRDIEVLNLIVETIEEPKKAYAVANRSTGEIKYFDFDPMVIKLRIGDAENWRRAPESDIELRGGEK